MSITDTNLHLNIINKLAYLAPLNIHSGAMPYAGQTENCGNYVSFEIQHEATTKELYAVDYVLS